MKTKIYVLIILLLATTSVFAEIKMGSPFTDHMVLQREMPISVWGWATKNSVVTVSIAGNRAKGKTGADGKWIVKLPALKAGGPYIMDIQIGADKKTLRDVLVGEVWIASGQSNMAMNWNGIPELKELAKEAASMPIRSFQVSQNISFKPQGTCKGTWTNKVPSSAVALSFSYYLQKGLNIPVGIILTSWGSSSIEGWMPYDMTEQLPHFKEIMKKSEADDKELCQMIMDMYKKTGKISKYCEDEEKNKELERKYRSANIYARTRPNYLYNAMMYPLIPYSCRGIIWYQGEANADRYEQYAVSLPLWVKRLRKGWDNKDLWFFPVMLPRFGKVSGLIKDPRHPGARSWAYMRESQLKILKLPNTGIANTIDLGDLKNIHPKDKRPVGERLAKSVLVNTYGKDTIGRCPAFAKMTVREKTVVITFKNCKQLKTIDGSAPKSFWMAGADKVWYQARAVIKNNSVLLTCDQVQVPKAVRYAFAAFPDVNLVSGADLPALPFRTDSW